MGNVINVTNKKTRNVEPISNLHDFYDIIIKYMGYDAKEWLEGYLKNIDKELEYYKIREEELIDELDTLEMYLM